jgi:MFS family permease
MQALTTGCTLLLSGTIADALGSRFMYLVGTVLQAGFILGCGLARNAAELILFRGLSGIAVSLCLPSAVSIITGSFVGKRRDMAFASMGGGQPVGFSIGLALGGVLTDTIGWRWGFYLAAILDAIVLGVAIWGLPREIDERAADPDSSSPATTTWREKLDRLKTEIDWVGAIIASTSLATLSYAFASITGNTADIRQPVTIALLSIAIALVPMFIFWVGRQERLGKPAIIPNSLWRNRTFTTICIAVFLTWGSFNALETILTFYFQRVQDLSAIQSSIRFLPAPVSGAVSNIAMGLLVHRVKANYLVFVGSIVSLGAPLAMVFATPTSSYWTSGK